MKQRVETLLEEDVLRCAKRRAAEEGRPLDDLLQDALGNYLAAGLRGREAEIVVPANEIGKLSRPDGSLINFFRKSLPAGVDLDLDRSRDTGRRIDL